MVVTESEQTTMSGKSFARHLLIDFISVSAGVSVFILGTYLVKTPPPCANSKTCDSDLTVKIENDAVGTFRGKEVIPPKINTNMENANPDISSSDAEISNAEKHIYVDLESQTLYAYSEKDLFMEALISSGKWGRTPVGNFNIWIKLLSTRMSGGEGADAYNLPNVPYVMYFYRDFGIHGAYWHDNFGHVMSHGCVNMRQVDAKALYGWANGPKNKEPGTAVSICNKFIKPDICVQENPVN